MTTCAWDREGKRIAGGIGDGSMQVGLTCVLISSVAKITDRLVCLHFAITTRRFSQLLLLLKI